MAHPNQREGVAGHNAKLKRLTQNYGAANKSMFKTAKGEQANGPQKAASFGEGAEAPSRGDRGRRSSSANPIPTYKRGGRAAAREKAEARAFGGGVIQREKGGSVPARAFGGGVMGRNRARGGAAKKGTTNVTIVVAPQSPPAGSNPALPPSGIGDTPPPLPKPPMAGPPPGAGGPGGPPGMPLPPGALPPGGMPPGLMAGMPGRARGGRIKTRAAGGPVEGSARPWPVGHEADVEGTQGTQGPGRPIQPGDLYSPEQLRRLEESAPPPDWFKSAPPPMISDEDRRQLERQIDRMSGPKQMLPLRKLQPMMRKRGGGVHADAKEDAAQIRKMVKPGALRARGGRMSSGADSGPGRLQKAANHARRGSDKVAEV